VAQLDGGAPGYVYLARLDAGNCALAAPHPNLRNGMATKLDKTIKRELELDGKLYTVAISPEGVKVTPKGARKGQEITWSSIVSGETELRRDLNASVDAYRE
jgi:hypothetical protein